MYYTIISLSIKFVGTIMRREDNMEYQYITIKLFYKDYSRGVN